MTTLPPPSVNSAPENSIEKKVYSIVDKYKDHLPVVNDRYRLGFTLFKYLKGEGDSPEILVKSTKIKLVGISEEEFAAKLSAELKDIDIVS